MHVFAYGTLMFPEVWQAVTGGDFASISGSLRGYAAFRVQDAVFPGIVRADDGCVVKGVLYLDVGTSALARLDRFEDDFYVRETVTIECTDGVRRKGEAYIVPDRNRHVLTEESWTRETFVASGGLEKFVAKFAGFGRVLNEER
jgi:gamma-glutamylcyclotransferase (GGCT)/AIG2-like uncharacterized protein YtfP